MQNILKIENLKKYYGTKNNITKRTTIRFLLIYTSGLDCFFLINFVRDPLAGILLV